MPDEGRTSVNAAILAIPPLGGRFSLDARLFVCVNNADDSSKTFVNFIFFYLIRFKICERKMTKNRLKSLLKIRGD